MILAWRLGHRPRGMGVASRPLALGRWRCSLLPNFGGRSLRLRLFRVSFFAFGLVTGLHPLSPQCAPPQFVEKSEKKVDISST